MATGRDILLRWVWVSLAALSGCGGPGGDIASGLTSEDPARRAQAAVEAGRACRRDLAGLLVDRLTDNEPEVRLVAIVSLEKITGQTLGYRYYDEPACREQAVRRWRQWLAEGEARP